MTESHMKELLDEYHKNTVEDLKQYMDSKQIAILDHIDKRFASKQDLHEMEDRLARDIIDTFAAKPDHDELSNRVTKLEAVLA
jgi:hypothetical protein